MQRALDKYEPTGEVPFAMRFMEVPSPGDRLQCHADTYTTVYTTFCGPNDNTPDDGAVTKMDK